VFVQFKAEDELPDIASPMPGAKIPAGMRRAEAILAKESFDPSAGVRFMPAGFFQRVSLLMCLASVFVTGCGKSSPVAGRWFNKDVSIRFREDGTAIYNSRATGLVEGRYQYDPAPLPPTATEPVKNLTVWLPQPGRTLALNFELKKLGSDRIQLKPISDAPRNPQRRDPSPVVGVVLKRATDESQHSDNLDETPPLVSATPGQGP
jgi:hypothetical protein